jgi:hypothetical protein
VSLKGPERPHGVRSKYVVEKCRCDLCREANRKYAEERSKLNKEIAASLNKGALKRWKWWHTAPRNGGKAEKVLYIFRKCPGVGGTPCRHKSFLRKDSTGNICAKCREGLINLYTTTPANKVRDCLIALKKMKVGLRSFAFLSEVSRSSLQWILRDASYRVTPGVEDRILDAFVTLAEEKPGGCEVCGKEHSVKSRLKTLLEILPASKDEILEEMPCSYFIKEFERKKDGHIIHVREARQMNYDLKRLKSSLIGGVYYSGVREFAVNPDDPSTWGDLKEKKCPSTRKSPSTRP